MSYLPSTIWEMPSGNVVNVHHVSAFGSINERWWEVREIEDGVMVQRRRYTSEAEAEAWIEEWGGVLMVRS